MADVLPFSPQILEELADRIQAISADNQLVGQNTIIAVAGGSSTGKSTQVAEGLRQRLADSQVISQDHYQLGRDYDMTADPLYRWDGLGNYGLPESCALLQSLRRSGENRQSATMPVYTFAEGQRTGVQLIEPTPIVLFEGLYAGFGDLRAQSDLLIYVEMPLYGRLLRRLFRSCFDRFRGDPSLSLQRTLAGGVLPAHRNLVRQQRATADLIVQMPYSFADTIQRFDLPEISRPYLVDSEMFTLRFGTSAWRVESDTINGLHVALFENDRLYFSFPTDADTLARLAALDLGEW
jgi:uridine kinase